MIKQYWIKFPSKSWTYKVLKIKIKKYDFLTYFISDSCQFILPYDGDRKFLENVILIAKSIKQYKKQNFARTCNRLQKEDRAFHKEV